MKANEAPMKIYLNPNAVPHNQSGNFLFIHNSDIDESKCTIEYTRTDIFIEKACEYWYQYNRNIVKNHGAKAVLGCSEFTVNVEGFKKYMK